MRLRGCFYLHCFLLVLLIGLIVLYINGNLGLRFKLQQRREAWCMERETSMQGRDSYMYSKLATFTSLLERYGLNKSIPRSTRDLPVIITGCDSYHYLESQGCIQSLHTNLRPKYRDFKIIYYDMGLKPNERTQLKKYCDCEVRSFPFDKYPAHVRRLKNYAFKPIIINTVMQEFGEVWWLDASIRITEGDITPAIRRLETEGVVFYSTNSQSGTPVWRTSRVTFDFFNVTPSFYLPYPEIESGYVMFKASEVTNRMLKLAATCALIEECIDPPGATLRGPSIYRSVSVSDVGKCHRYDQSILNIMFWKQFPCPASRQRPQWLKVQRGNRFQYFPIE